MLLTKRFLSFFSLLAVLSYASFDDQRISTVYEFESDYGDSDIQNFYRGLSRAHPRIFPELLRNINQSIQNASSGSREARQQNEKRLRELQLQKQFLTRVSQRNIRLFGDSQALQQALATAECGPGESLKEIALKESFVHLRFECNSRLFKVNLNRSLNESDLKMRLGRELYNGIEQHLRSSDNKPVSHAQVMDFIETQFLKEINDTLAKATHSLSETMASSYVSHFDLGARGSSHISRYVTERGRKLGNEQDIDSEIGMLKYEIDLSKNDRLRESHIASLNLKKALIMRARDTDFSEKGLCQTLQKILEDKSLKINSEEITKVCPELDKSHKEELAQAEAKLQKEHEAEVERDRELMKQREAMLFAMLKQACESVAQGNATPGSQSQFDDFRQMFVGISQEIAKIQSDSNPSVILDDVLAKNDVIDPMMEVDPEVVRSIVQNFMKANKGGDGRAIEEELSRLRNRFKAAERARISLASIFPNGVSDTELQKMPGDVRNNIIVAHNLEKALRASYNIYKEEYDRLRSNTTSNLTQRGARQGSEVGSVSGPEPGSANNRRVTRGAVREGGVGSTTRPGGGNLERPVSPERPKSNNSGLY